MKLRWIRLSNIRRLAPLVDIEFGDGATILLAPNGYGKTSIFEGIELALTGGVRRLESQHLTLLRDGEKNAGVRLEFDEGNVIEAKLGKTGHIRQTGDLANILGNHKPQDLPFLLRLTHLLDQREVEWCTQANRDEAGRQLGSLPIGREAVQANEALRGARQRIARKLTEAKETLDYAERERANWTSLLMERARYTNDHASSRTPLIDLSLRLKTVLRLDHEPTAEVYILSQEVGVGWDRISRELDDADELSIRLGRLDSVPEVFTNASEELRTANEEIDALKRREESLKSSGNDAGQRLESLKQRRIVSDKEYQRTQEVLRQIDSFNRAERQKQTLESELAVKNAAQEVAKGKRQDLIEKLATARLVSIRQGTLTRQLESSRTKWRETQEAQSAIGTWNGLQDRLSQLLRSRRDAAGEIAILEQKQAELLLGFNAVTAEFNAEQTKLRALRASCDAIRAAVAQIAEHLPEDATHCPTCGVTHRIGELKGRISSALDGFDPKLRTQIDLLASCDARRANAQQELESVQAEIASTVTRQREIANSESSTLQEIEAIHARIAQYGSNPEQAAISINEQCEALPRTIEQLEHGLSAATKELEEAGLSALDAAIVEADSELNSCGESIALLSSELQRVTAQLEAQVPAAGQDTIHAQAALAAKELTELDVELHALEVKQRQTSEQLFSNQSEIERLELRALALKRTIAEVTSEWETLLPLPPSADLCAREKEQLQKRIVSLKDARRQLGELRDEIAKWEAFNPLLELNKRVERLIGQESESSYGQRVEEAVGRRRSAVERLELLRESLQVLANELGDVLKDVQTQVGAISEIWQVLLKRVVLDSRICEAQLNMFSKHRKERAQATVPMHGTTVQISHVASKAQAADLQLTFLLAMAIGKPWCNWRSLLLDDPTQHHDIVHASGVFDLLRDYVSDFQFQLLFSTHDPLQARFLKRKLLNDGLPVRLVTLRQTGEGVIAASEP